MEDKKIAYMKLVERKIKKKTGQTMKDIDYKKVNEDGNYVD